MSAPEEIKVGDTIRHSSLPPGLMDVEVLEVKDCEEGSAADPEHPQYRILDPESGEPDWVCSLEFVRVYGAVQ